MTLKGKGGGGQSPITGRVSLNKVTNPGDVLVAKMTDPSMLADMAKASAVVTDEGGALCHAAIVCIDLGIPFVVGTREATSHLKDGDFVTVNPVTGEVTIG